MAAQKKQLLLVDGAVTQVLSVEVTREVATLDFFDKVQIPRTSVNSPLLPKNTRLYRANNISEEYIIEEPPGIWMVSHTEGRGAVFQIAVPWTIFTVNVSRSGEVINQPFLHFSKTRIDSSTARVQPSFLPNQHQSGVCCGGDEFSRIMSSRDPLLTRLDRIVPFFKNSQFNEDLRPSWVPNQIGVITPDSEEAAGLDPQMFAVALLARNDTPHNLRLLCRWHLWTMHASQRHTQPAEALRRICDLIPTTAGVPLGDLARVR